MSGYPEEFSRKLSMKFPVYVFELPSSVAGIIDLVNRVGIVAEQPGRAAEIEKDLIARLSAFHSRRDLTAYVEIDLGGPVSFGYRSYITDALSLLGISNIYGNVDKEWLEPDFENVEKLDPDIIFYEPKMYSKFTEEGARKLISNRGWNNLKAVKNNAFFVSPGPLDFIAHHGPTFIREVLPWMEMNVSGTYGS